MEPLLREEPSSWQTVPTRDSPSLRFTLPHRDVLVDGGSVLDQLTRDPVDPRIRYYKFVAVTADHTIEPSFAIDTKTLTVSKSGTGTVRSPVMSQVLIAELTARSPMITARQSS